jgi:hypothetical protein
MREVFFMSRTAVALIVFLGTVLFGAKTTMAADGLEEFTFVLQTKADQNVPADMSVCSRAPFPTNVAIGATVWSVKVRKDTGEVVRQYADQVGTGTACFLFTDLRFLPQSRVKVFAGFNLYDGTYIGSGDCLITSNTIPVRGIVMMGCTAAILDAPPRVIGGLAITTTLMNVASIPGYTTGSTMTIRGYRLHEEHGRGDGCHERDVEQIDADSVR